MTNTAPRPIVKGDRFQSNDPRDNGRVVEVIEERGIAPEIEAAINRFRGLEGRELRRQKATYFAIKTEAHPTNPDAIGNVSRISEHGLRTRFTRISR